MKAVSICKSNYLTCFHCRVHCDLHLFCLRLVLLLLPAVLKLAGLRRRVAVLGRGVVLLVLFLLLLLLGFAGLLQLTGLGGCVLTKRKLNYKIRRP